VFAAASSLQLAGRSEDSDTLEALNVWAGCW